MILDIETTAREDAADFLGDIEAPSNYKKPEAIEAYITEERAKRLEKAAATVDLCRVIHVGILQDDGIETHWTNRGDSEAFNISVLWDICSRVRVANERLVTFNGTAFDWPVLARRSQILGIEIPYWFSLDKYRSELAKADVANVLTFNGLIGFHKSQRYYCKLFGIPCGDETFTGADIPRLYADGRYDDITAKNSDDLHCTRLLAERLGILAPARVEVEA